MPQTPILHRKRPIDRILDAIVVDLGAQMKAAEPAATERKRMLAKIQKHLVAAIKAAREEA